MMEVVVAVVAAALATPTGLMSGTSRCLATR